LIALAAENRKGAVKGGAATARAVRDIHRRFCETLPDDLPWVEDPATHEKSKGIPGALRARDVALGDHVAISAGAVPRLLRRFEVSRRSPGSFCPSASTQWSSWKG
jgi:hypothetical protein